MTPSLSGRIAEIVPGRAAEHPLRLDADRVHLAGALVDRDHRRLGEHDPAAAHVDERVGGAEVHGHVAAAEAGEGAEEGHRRASESSYPIPVRPRKPLGEQADEQRAGQTDDVQVVALDPLDEAAAEPLDRVGAGAALPLAAARRRRRCRAASASRKRDGGRVVLDDLPARA